MSIITAAVAAKLYQIETAEDVQPQRFEGDEMRFKFVIGGLVLIL